MKISLKALTLALACSGLVSAANAQALSSVEEPWQRALPTRRARSNPPQCCIPMPCIRAARPTASS